MKTLNIQFDFRSLDEASRGVASSPDRSVPFPFKVLSQHGQVLAEGVANSYQSKEIVLQDRLYPYQVFVRIAFPSGRSVTQRVDLTSRDSASVVFTDDDLAGEAWAKWALTRSSRASPVPAPLAKFGNVWFRLWSRTDTGWHPSSELPRSNSVANVAAKQVDLDLDLDRPQLLQFGGAKVAWTFVSLPPGRCRMYFTTNPASDNTSLPIKLVLTSFQPEAETLLEFLSRDALGAADSVSKFLATRLLHDKMEDPVSAIVGAYFLLRIGQWKDVSPQWFDNLYRAFPWSSDAALIRCAVTCRQGLSGPSAVNQFLTQMDGSFSRGVPLFAEGHRLLLELQSTLQSLMHENHWGIETDKFEELLRKCRALSAARVWVGSSFAFTGNTPDAPSSQRRKGSAPDDEVELLPSEDESTALSMAPMSFSASMLERVASDEISPSTHGQKRRRAKRSDVVYLKDL